MAPSPDLRTEEDGGQPQPKEVPGSWGNGTGDPHSAKTNWAPDPALLVAVPVRTKNWYPVRTGGMKRR